MTMPHARKGKSLEGDSEYQKIWHASPDEEKEEEEGKAGERKLGGTQAGREKNDMAKKEKQKETEGRTTMTKKRSKTRRKRCGEKEGEGERARESWRQRDREGEIKRKKRKKRNNRNKDSQPSAPIEGHGQKTSASQRTSADPR